MMTQGISYLDPLLDEMARQWPNNRTINIVCHGHSVPAGYFATPYVNTFHAYPHLLHKLIKERFPFAVTNVIVTAIGGENAEGGAERFEKDVLSHKPDVVTIDYSLNDRSIGLDRARSAWESMIQAALGQNIRVILCTPTWDNSWYRQDEAWQQLVQHARQVRELADRYEVALADTFRAFERNISEPADLVRYLSHVNHPTEAGHQLAAQEIAKYFVAR
ncbi:MAG: SGNH/GDSL hydrolase family protein [Oscillospiraceae bacterium]|nr:SGNH/GDSL hydrolase family protein [Oscillospiraceae bacterium]